MFMSPTIVFQPWTKFIYKIIFRYKDVNLFQSTFDFTDQCSNILISSVHFVGLVRLILTFMIT